MKQIIILLVCVLVFSQHALTKEKNVFPDGSRIPSWFLETKKVEPKSLGKVYDITAFGAVNDSMVLQTAVIQKVIDEATNQGGGVVFIPKGVYLTGALFFKPKTHLYVSEGAVLKGSDNIEDYPLLPSRMEGQNLDYYSALVNANGLDGFTISGKGTIDGNGLKFWQSFWQRRKENPKCTNLEVSRPRLLFIRNCNNVQIQDVKLHNSGFWTNHFYKCKNVKMIDLHIFAPVKPVAGPSTDAIDIDVCSNFLVKGCYISVNDDGVCLKGGKGPWADMDTCNGENTNILVEDCSFGFCHSVLTCGSESIHDKNILLRNCKVKGANKLLWLKMRPDTPQKYEYVTVENVEGEADKMLELRPWTQFFDLKGRTDLPVSICENIIFKNIHLKCKEYMVALASEKYLAKRFTFQNIWVETAKGSYDKSIFLDATYKQVQLVEPAKRATKASAKK
jgi:polygalacturonase